MLRVEVLRTRVARRIFLLFVLSAMAPVVVLGVYSYGAVTAQLRDQSRDRLQQLSKSAGMSIMERLRHAEEDLELVAADARLARRGEGVLAARPGRPLRSLAEVVVTGPDQAPDGAPAPALRDTERNHLARGGTLLRVRRPAVGEPALWMVKRLGQAQTDGLLVWARMQPDYLWSSAPDYVNLPSIGGFCVLLDVRPLHCAGYDAAVQERMIEAYRTSPAAGRGIFTWATGDEEHIGSHWELFLRSTYQSGSWTVLVGEPTAATFEPLGRFTQAFPPVLLFGLLVVTLLANGLVRRTLDPLEKLAEGTARVAAADFGARVEVERPDEFGALAASFNTMAQRLGVQFRHLEASRSIDQAVLAANRWEEVAEALLGGLGSVVPFQRMAVLVLRRDEETGDLRWAGPDGARGEAVLRPGPEDLAYLAGGEVLLAEEGAQPSVLLGFTEARPILVLPIRMKGQVTGAVMLGRRAPFEADEIRRARQIVDQAAVALDQVQLVSALEDMNWGTLRALARAIDAKSRWTAGHSERVVELALDIGRELGLSARQMETLRRGGMLHDIGKIGIPAGVLDAERPLDEDERSLMQGHVTIGARILEPVHAYADVIPIVLYHHEAWDGTGYPRGLRGEEIPLLARILSVADAYDAMVSVRPYRTASSGERALQLIQKLAGRQFDPAVVDAFMRIVTRDAPHARTLEPVLPGATGGD